MTTGTVEERIDEMIVEKRKLADDILNGGGEVNLTELSDEALIDLVRLDVTRAAGWSELHTIKRAVSGGFILPVTWQHFWVGQPQAIRRLFPEGASAAPPW